MHGESGQASLLQVLSQQVENLYTNNFLSHLNVRWQQFVDTCQVWEAAPVASQANFFERFAADAEPEGQGLRADLRCLPLRSG